MENNEKNKYANIPDYMIENIEDYLKYGEQLANLNRQVNPTQEEETSAIRSPSTVRGDRNDFVKLTITMCPKMLKNLKILSATLSSEGEKDVNVSALLRRGAEKVLSRY